MDEPDLIQHTFYDVDNGYLLKRTIKQTDLRFVGSDEHTVTVVEQWEDFSGCEHEDEKTYPKNKNVAIQRSVDYAEKCISDIKKRINELRKQMDP